MSGTVIALVAISLTSALSELLLPNEDERGTRTALRFMTAIVTLLLIAAPLLPQLGSAKEFLHGEIAWTEDEAHRAELEAQLQQALSAQGAKELEAWCQALLAERHGLSEQQATVRAVTNASGELTVIAVRLSGAGLLKDPREIARTLSDYFDCEIEVR